jgi:hypothetical protein
MAKLFPDWQEYVALKGTSGVGRQESMGIHRVTIVSSTSDHLAIPTAEDAAILQTDKTTANPTFYITDSTNEGSQAVAIDGATVGTEYVVVTRHSGKLNFKE